MQKVHEALCQKSRAQDEAGIMPEYASASDRERSYFGTHLLCGHHHVS